MTVLLLPTNIDKYFYSPVQTSHLTGLVGSTTEMDPKPTTDSLRCSQGRTTYTRLAFVHTFNFLDLPLQVGQISRWNKEGSLGNLYPKPCDRLEGSAGEFFPQDQV